MSFLPRIKNTTIDEYFIAHHGVWVTPSMVKSVRKFIRGTTIDPYMSSGAIVAGISMIGKSCVGMTLGSNNSQSEIKRRKLFKKYDIEDPIIMKGDGLGTIKGYPSSSVDTIITRPFTRYMGVLTDNIVTAMTKNFEDTMHIYSDVIRVGGHMIFFYRDRWFSKNFFSMEHILRRAISFGFQYKMKTSYRVKTIPLECEEYPRDAIHCSIFKLNKKIEWSPEEVISRDVRNGTSFWKASWNKESEVGLKTVITNLEEQTMSGEYLFKIAGLNMDKATRKAMRWLLGKYPDITEGVGKRPKIKLVHKPFVGEKEEDYDPNAVRVYIRANKKWVPVGWIPKKITDGLQPNALVSKFLDHDKTSDDKIIKKVKISEAGSFEDRGKILYWMKIVIQVDLDVMKKYRRV